MWCVIHLLRGISVELTLFNGQYPLLVDLYALVFYCPASANTGNLPTYHPAIPYTLFLIFIHHCPHYRLQYIYKISKYRSG